ncbi:MAG TPA: PilZ domain-containing protein [Tepidisphaeraceae bacterium]|nr:PilZ domain-containing protein [Tepidisphaeraceae bacterium]
MQLTADLYREILRSLRSDNRSSRNLEKRAAPRVGLRSKLTIVPSTGSAPTNTCVRDISAHGIGLVHPESMPIGSQFTAMFAGRANDTLAVVYTVANCKEISKSLYSIGATVSRIDRVLASTPRKTSAA